MGDEVGRRARVVDLLGETLGGAVDPESPVERERHHVPGAVEAHDEREVDAIEAVGADAIGRRMAEPTEIPLHQPQRIDPDPVAVASLFVHRQQRAHDAVEHENAAALRHSAAPREAVDVDCADLHLERTAVALGQGTDRGPHAIEIAGGEALVDVGERIGLLGTGEQRRSGRPGQRRHPGDGRRSQRRLVGAEPPLEGRDHVGCCPERRMVDAAGSREHHPLGDREAGRSIPLVRAARGNDEVVRCVIEDMVEQRVAGDARQTASTRRLVVGGDGAVAGGHRSGLVELGEEAVGILFGRAHGHQAVETLHGRDRQLFDHADDAGDRVEQRTGRVVGHEVGEVRERVDETAEVIRVGERGAVARCRHEHHLADAQTCGVDADVFGALGQHAGDETATRMGEHIDDQPGVGGEHLSQATAVLGRVDRDRGMVEREDAPLVALVEAGDDLVRKPAEPGVRQGVDAMDHEQRRSAGQRPQLVLVERSRDGQAMVRGR